MVNSAAVEGVGMSGGRSDSCDESVYIVLPFDNNVVARFLPALVLTDELAEKGMAIVMDCVQEVEPWVMTSPSVIRVSDIYCMQSIARQSGITLCPQARVSSTLER